MIHHDIRLSGKVQGVSFRMFTLLQAKALEIRGWVRNEDDGTVYMEAEGEPAAMEEFVTRLRQGPRFARVDHVEIREGDVKHYREFEIL